jgi:hypothetical protein
MLILWKRRHRSNMNTLATLIFSGAALSMAGCQSSQSSAQQRADRVGSHVDPSNPQIIQGRHTVYQGVGQPGWNLHIVHHGAGPLPPYVPAPQPDQAPAWSEASRKAQEPSEAAVRLQQRVEALEHAQKPNAAAVNDNQQ